VKARERRGEPALSVDTKKKEVLGNLRNAGTTYRRKGDPQKVKTHDFPDPKLGKAVPYGVYDIHGDEAGVSVGISHDTAEFAVGAIRRWWEKLGCRRYAGAKRVLITAGSGGSNGSRNRLWKLELQELADETGLIFEVCHYPPGTSKWNKIEHRLFCHITRNWRGKPLETLEVVVESIGDDDGDGAGSACLARRRNVREGPDGERRAVGGMPDQTPHVPRRMELRNPPAVGLRMR